MIYFKSCPRCRGDVNLTIDIFGKYLSCLQCGFLRDIVDDAPQSQDKKPEPVVAADRELLAA